MLRHPGDYRAAGAGWERAGTGAGLPRTSAGATPLNANAARAIGRGGAGTWSRRRAQVTRVTNSPVRVSIFTKSPSSM